MRLRSLALTFALLIAAAFPAQAQWQVPSGSIPVGKGPGNTGFNTVTGSAGAGTKCLLDTTPPTFSACPGSGTPGGSNLQIQYNNAGAFGGLTDVQVTARIQAFSNVLSGAVPASGGGTTNFLRADGTFAAPPGGGLTVGTTGIASGTTMGVLYNNAGVLGNTAAGTLDYMLSGNGATAPTFKGFLQPLTNAITRTWQAKALEIISVKDFGALCDGSTDDSTAIQNAISALGSNGGTILFPKSSTCVFGTTLTSSSKAGVTLKGQGRMQTSTAVSVLQYSGTGARAIDLRDSSAWTFDGIGIFPSNNAFNGIVIDVGATNFPTTISSLFNFRNGQIFGNGTNTPSICINISEAIEATIEHSVFGNCAIGIRGQQTLASNTVTKISGNQFGNIGTSPISDCGEAWTVINNTFEPLITSNNAAAMTNNSARPCLGLTYAGNWHGDANSTGTWLTLTANGAQIYGNEFGSGATGVSLVAGGGYVVEGNSFKSITTALALSSTPTVGVYGPNFYTSVTNCFTGTGASFNLSNSGCSSAPVRTQQRFTSGSGTYTTPAFVKYIVARGVGGGGGGGGGGTGAPTNGTTGGNTTFSTATANGGPGGRAAALANGFCTAAAATASGGTLNITGGQSDTVQSAVGTGHGTRGADAPFFNGGGNAGTGAVGAGAGITNSGGGGGGGGSSGGAATDGAGGCSGAYFEFIITAPAASYSYGVGAGGAVGAAGTNGNAGALGGSGIVVVDEYYQ